LTYFHSWAGGDFSASIPVTSNLLEQDNSVFAIVFTGNLGEVQIFPTILEAAEELKSKCSALGDRWVGASGCMSFVAGISENQ
jgi:hypothetical protein